ncbi:MAG: D-alanyl-D-alanine carboxypeptidase [Clostridia bacterium]|nr:D-alanyl-D-alanine carboxypeptidase [Clostridia bacterium]
MSKQKMSKKQMMRKKQRNRRIVTFIIGFVVIALIWLGVLIFIGQRQKKAQTDTAVPTQEAQIPEEQTTETPEATATPEPTPTAEPLPTVDLSAMDSKSGILIRLSDGSVVAEKEADTRIYPASMTKIMTAVIALENLTDMEALIPIDAATYDMLYTQEASMAGFAPGDQVKAIDMLYGIMLPSGAECCLGVAEHLFGSEEAFVAKMNEKAQELGMTNTHFVTSTGLHDPEHYTTARDLSKLLSYALQNETFRTIYCSHEYTTSPTAGNPEGLHFLSTMFKKMDTSAINGGEIEGGKTGYTSDAGQCLASLAMVDSTEYILITAGAQGGPSTEPYHILDAIAVYDQIAGTDAAADTASDTTTDTAADAALAETQGADDSLAEDVSAQ